MKKIVGAAVLAWVVLDGGVSAQPMQLSAADSAAIYQLYAAYALALDTGDGKGVANTFTPDGTFKSYLSNQQPEPVGAVRRRVDAEPHKKIPDASMMHIMFSPRFTPTPDGAIGTVYQLVPRPAPGGQFTFDTGYYTDTLVKTRRGWRFKSRTLITAGHDYLNGAGEKP